MHKNTLSNNDASINNKGISDPYGHIWKVELLSSLIKESWKQIDKHTCLHVCKVMNIILMFLYITPLLLFVRKLFGKFESKLPAE